MDTSTTCQYSPHFVHIRHCFDFFCFSCTNFTWLYRLSRSLNSLPHIVHVNSDVWASILCWSASVAVRKYKGQHWHRIVSEPSLPVDQSKLKLNWRISRQLIRNFDNSPWHCKWFCNRLRLVYFKSQYLHPNCNGRDVAFRDCFPIVSLASSSVIRSYEWSMIL